MPRLARLLLTILALSFAAGVSVQAMAAAPMDLPMAMSGAAGEPMPDCDHCGGDADETVCLIACTLPVLDMVSPELALRPLTKCAVQALAAPAIVGQSRPPDPHPPRLAPLA
jgi:hypothetical protein